LLMIFIYYSLMFIIGIVFNCSLACQPLHLVPSRLLPVCKAHKSGILDLQKTFPPENHKVDTLRCSKLCCPQEV